MEEFLVRAFHQLLQRTAGPFHLRFILQPVTAAVIAIRAGLKDAQVGGQAYLWRLFSTPNERGTLLRSAWAEISRVFTVGIAIDGIYQLAVFHWIYPVQALIVACVLTLIPYIMIRGPVTRFAGRLKRGSKSLSIPPAKGPTRPVLGP